jgi:hypothetical protein
MPTLKWTTIVQALTMLLLVDANLATLGKNVKVKIECTLMSCYIDPLYGVKLDIIFGV